MKVSSLLFISTSFIIGFFTTFYSPLFQEKPKQIIKIALPNGVFSHQFFEKFAHSNNLKIEISHYTEGSRLDFDFDFIYVNHSDFEALYLRNLITNWPFIEADNIPPEFRLLNSFLPYHYSIIGFYFDPQQYKRDPAKLADLLDLRKSTPSKLQIDSRFALSALERDKFLQTAGVNSEHEKVWLENLRNLRKWADIQPQHFLKDPVELTLSGSGSLHRANGLKFLSPTDVQEYEIWGWVARRPTTLNAAFSKYVQSHERIKDSLATSHRAVVYRHLNAHADFQPHQKAQYFRSQPIGGMRLRPSLGANQRMWSQWIEQSSIQTAQSQ